VDEIFPKDLRSSGQGLFNLLILGLGNVVASFLFPALASYLSQSPGGGGVAAAAIDYRALFLVPTGMALVAVLLLAALFRPPHPRPVAARERPSVPEGGVHAAP
jgi:MFS family permease